jgi:hypothetical protein
MPETRPREKLRSGQGDGRAREAARPARTVVSFVVVAVVMCVGVKYEMCRRLVVVVGSTRDHVSVLPCVVRFMMI